MNQATDRRVPAVQIDFEIKDSKSLVIPPELL
jgi:hypothetical protein